MRKFFEISEAKTILREKSLLNCPCNQLKILAINLIHEILI